MYSLIWAAGQISQTHLLLHTCTKFVSVGILHPLSFDRIADDEPNLALSPDSHFVCSEQIACPNHRHWHDLQKH